MSPSISPWNQQGGISRSVAFKSRHPPAGTGVTPKFGFVPGFLKVVRTHAPSDSTRFVKEQSARPTVPLSDENIRLYNSRRRCARGRPGAQRADSHSRKNTGKRQKCF